MEARWKWSVFGWLDSLGNGSDKVDWGVQSRFGYGSQVQSINEQGHDESVMSDVV